MIGLNRLRPSDRVGKIIARGYRGRRPVACFVQGKRGADHGGVIERETRRHEYARAPGMCEALVPLRIGKLQRRGDEIIGPRGKTYPFRLAKKRRGIDERGDHQAVPIGKNFVVEARADALVPRLE